MVVIISFTSNPMSSARPVQGKKPRLPSRNQGRLSLRCGTGRGRSRESSPCWLWGCQTCCGCCSFCPSFSSCWRWMARKMVRCSCLASLDWEIYHLVSHTYTDLAVILDSVRVLFPQCWQWHTTVTASCYRCFLLLYTSVGCSTNVSWPGFGRLLLEMQTTILPLSHTKECNNLKTKTNKKPHLEIEIICCLLANIPRLLSKLLVLVCQRIVDISLCLHFASMKTVPSSSSRLWFNMSIRPERTQMKWMVTIF